MATDTYRESVDFPQPSSSSEYMEEMNEACIICNKGFAEETDKVTLGEKGALKINNVSKECGENVLAASGNHVHSSCRRIFTNQYYVSLKTQKQKATTSPRKMRPREPADNSIPKCLFCGHGEKLLKRNTGKLIPVRTMKVKESILEYVQKREDRWARDVKARIDYMQDLVAHDAVYHNVCYSNFRSGFALPRAFVTDEPPAKKQCFGRPRNERCAEAFSSVIQHLENSDTDQCSLSELVRVMETNLTEADSAYSTLYMKRKLKEHYGDEIIISEKTGATDIVSLKSTAGSILRDFNKQPKSSNPEAQKHHIITTAAKLLLSDIRSMDCNKDTYPEIKADEQVSFLPDSLQIFLKELLKGRDTSLKQAAIGQAIIQIVRPKLVLAPLQIGLAVQMHKAFGSRFLVDTLHRLGFSSSYAEVRRFEINAASQQGVDLPTMKEDQTLQFVADNVDHNLITLDGHNTFHGMGIIAVTTPGVSQHRSIPRKDVQLKDVKAVGRIGIYYYSSDWRSLDKLIFRELPEISVTEPTSYLDTLWKISWPLKSPRPAWKGLMQAVHNSEHPGKSEVFFMPMIDLNPGDLSCIYSTLRFIVSQASKCNMTPVITFDQPLYLKALSIINSRQAGDELKSIVLRLGCFHLQMSFLGSIGNLMAGSGLQEAFETIFAPNAVVHIMSGKAYDRATRAHLLADAALNAMLTVDAFQVPWILVHHGVKEDQTERTEEYVEVPEESSGAGEQEGKPMLLQPVSESQDQQVRLVNSGHDAAADLDLQDTSYHEAVPTTGYDDLDTAATFIERILKDDIPSDEEMQEPLLRIEKKIETYKESLIEKRTSKLWLQYLEMVNILKNSIKADRTGNFKLHLKSTYDMLPYFAASGHYNYLKCARLYLQQMLELSETHPDVYRHFMSGHHSVRRTDRYWAGLPTDLIIEQVLMRSLKTNGGLTRGRGMNETERLVWLLSMPACAEINSAMQSATGIFSDSGQHKDTRNTRMKRDHKDTRTILEFFLRRNPFCGDATLRSLSSGRIADSSVNVDSSKEIGFAILKSMSNFSVATLKLKRQSQAVTLATQSSMTTEGETINVDPALLFQRLVQVAEMDPDRIATAFHYELTNIPTSLFEPSGLPREAKKHILANTLWSRSNHQDKVVDVLPCAHYVLDGGSLLHSLSWGKGMTYNQIIETYVEYIIRKYPGSSIVFDGYSCGPSTKDAAHLRRKNGRRTGHDVDFVGDMTVSETRDSFLANSRNKQQFINRLSVVLQDSGIETYHADGDADCLIVSTTLTKAKDEPTVLIGQDTDLLVLLLHHTTADGFEIFFNTGKRIWDVRATQASLGPDICENILFCHAVTGCDTTSAPFSIGKSAPFLMLQESSSFRQAAEVFIKPGTSDEVIGAGEQALSLLFGGRKGDNLDKLRYIKYVQKVSTSASALEPKRLPPTSASAQFHSLRTYFQVQEWMTLGESTLSPTDWGWEVQDNLMLPVYTNAAAAPEELLHIVKCNCRTDCGSARCSCRRHGLVCTAACGDCRGESCTNRVHVVDDDDIDSNI